MKWNAKDVEKLDLKHNLTKKNKEGTFKNKKLTKISNFSVEKDNIKHLLWLYKREGIIPEYVDELQFHHKRKFRFDWAIPEWKIAIEYEGIFSKKSGHTTVSGYTKDCEKYNLATLEGWKILRYTAKNYKELGNDLRFISKN